MTLIARSPGVRLIPVLMRTPASRMPRLTARSGVGQGVIEIFSIGCPVAVGGLGKAIGKLIDIASSSQRRHAVG